MYEVKADALDASFGAPGLAAAAGADRLARVEADLAVLKGRVAGARRGALGRPALDGVKGMGDDPARTAFVDRYIRRGQEAGLELKSLSGATGASGGYAVPPEIDAQIDRALTALSPIRVLANVVRTGTAGYRKLIATGGTPAGWAGETGARAETATPTFHEIAPPGGDLYANPAASQAMLDDAAFDVETWLADEIAQEFARAEGAAFVGGSGVNQPKGFLTYAASDADDATRPFGTVQYVPSGADGGFAAASPQDALVDLVQALKAPYRQGAAFVMNGASLARIRKFKTADGAFLWQPSMSADAPATLLGYPVIEAEDMPDIAPGSLSVAFGNFRRGYVVAERTETSILRDPFSNKPFVHFYAVKRLGGAMVDSAAIKLMKFSAA